MDNRRVFKSSYREKTRENASPYARKSGGLFSKVKSFFAPAMWSSNNNDSSGEPSNSSASAADSLKPFTFPEPETSLINTPSRADTPGSQQLQLQPPLETPNKVLSSFFQEKGDKPLSEIEYEGVVSLLAQARSQNNTPNNSVIYRGEANESDKPFEPASESTAHNQTQNDSVLKSEPHNFAITPYNQTTLRSGDGNDASAILSTPDYKPVYPSTNDSKNIPSVKRVYQFSGLPSPYRTRIRVPSFSKPKRPTRISPNSTANSSFLNPSHSSKNTKPMSNAANTLLNILDGNTSGTSEISEPDNSMKNISNPYSGQSSVRKRKVAQDKFSHNLSSTPTKKIPRIDANDNDNDNINDSEIHHSNIITADDISKTVSFNKAEELPVSDEKPQVSTATSTDPEFDLFPSKLSQGKVKPFSAPSTTHNNASTNSHSNSLRQNLDNNGTPSFGVQAKADDPKSNGTSNNKQTSLNGISIPALNGTSNDKSRDGKPPFNSNGSSIHKPLPSFGDSAPNGHISDQSTEISGISEQFDFPVIEQVAVDLDLEEVEKYKAQFHF